MSSDEVEGAAELMGRGKHSHGQEVFVDDGGRTNTGNSGAEDGAELMGRLKKQSKLGSHCVS